MHLKRCDVPQAWNKIISDTIANSWLKMINFAPSENSLEELSILRIDVEEVTRDQRNHGK